MGAFVKVSDPSYSIPDAYPISGDTNEEFPFLHTVTVIDRVVSVDNPELVQNNIGTETVTCNLDSEWDGLNVVVNIGNDEPVSVIWTGEPVTIPAQCMTDTGTLDVSIVGVDTDGTVRAVTKKASGIFNVVASGYVTGEIPEEDATSILGQLIDAAGKANASASKADSAASSAISSAGNANTSASNAASAASRADASASKADAAASDASSAANEARDAADAVRTSTIEWDQLSEDCKTKIAATASSGVPIATQEEIDQAYRDVIEPNLSGPVPLTQDDIDWAMSIINP